MDQHEIEVILKNNTIFSTLNDDTRNYLLSQLIVIELSKNENLYLQGDPSESIYFLVKGQLVSLVVNTLDEISIIGYINPGESVGQMGVITNEPRSLTVKAVTNSILLKLHKKIFYEIINKYPSVMMAIINPVISRSEKILEIFSMDEKEKTVVIMPANRNTTLNEFANVLQKNAKKYKSMIIISDYETEFSDKNVDIKTVKERIKNITKRSKRIHRICYILSSYDTPLARFAFQQAKMAYIVAFADSNPEIDSELKDKIETNHYRFSSDPSLVLIHHAGVKAPSKTIEWIRLLSIKLHHHIRMDNNGDFRKLLRFIQGKAVGVVLSGGGTRGWAHIGAIKAIREAKIPIDIIGGTSVGAVIAGLYGLNESYKNIYTKFHQMVVESKRSTAWYNLTWPIISIFNAKNFTNAHINIFKDKQIEDLWIPYFCVTSNMATNSEEVIKHGVLWKAIRASSSIPGIMPPMVIDGKIHLDGGLLNSLPTDVMHQLIGQRGKIIAIDLNTVTTDETTYDFPPVLTLKDIILYKLRLIKKFRFPSFIDMFLRAIFLSSTHKGKDNARFSTIYVNPELLHFKLLHSNPEEGEQLMNIGYEETKKSIEQFRNKK